MASRYEDKHLAYFHGVQGFSNRTYDVSRTIPSAPQVGQQIRSHDINPTMTDVLSTTGYLPRGVPRQPSHVVTDNRMRLMRDSMVAYKY